MYGGDPQRDYGVGMYEKYIKRLLDILISGVGLVLLCWLFLLIAIIICIDDPGPVFFTQKRYGRNKAFFQLHKFRTMKVSAPHDVPTDELENSASYITRAGRFLRKSSLDEIPQFWDVFIGKMSMIGPRPALWNQYDLIESRDQSGANSVRPGLTGWAQVNGRDAMSFKQKTAYDAAYAEAMRKGGMEAFKMDLKCFWMTFGSVLTHKGFVEGKQ